MRKHNLDPVEYLCDVFCRIMKTTKDKLVDLLAHRWNWQQLLLGHKFK